MPSSTEHAVGWYYCTFIHSVVCNNQKSLIDQTVLLSTREDIVVVNATTKKANEQDAKNIFKMLCWRVKSDSICVHIWP